MTPDSALLLTAHKRPDYFRETLESWSCVPELDQLDHITVALGRSPREDEQLQVIEQFTHAVKPPVRVRWDSAHAVVSPSVHRALGEAIASEFAQPGLEFLVCSEEDVIVSSDVLAYMTWARERFEADPRVLTISAHNPIGQGWHQFYDDSDADQQAVRFQDSFHPWCWATWKDRWQGWLEPNWDWDATTGTDWYDNGYDWQVCRIMKRNSLVSPAPDASRSQNIGKYEGVYALPENFPLTQSASFRERRENPSYQMVEEAAHGAPGGT